MHFLFPRKLRRQIEECKSSEEAGRLVSVAANVDPLSLWPQARKKKKELFFLEQEQEFQEKLRAALGSEEKLLDLLRRIDPLDWWYNGSPCGHYSQHIALIQQELRPFTKKRILEATTSSELMALEKESRIDGDLEKLYNQQLTIFILQEVIVAERGDAECFSVKLGIGIIDTLIITKKNMLLEDPSAVGRQQILDAVDEALKYKLEKMCK